MFFFDEAKIKVNESDSIETGHYLFNFYSKRGRKLLPDHTIPILIFLVVFIVQKYWFYVIGKLGICCKKRLGKFYQEKNLVVDEKLDPFWNSINGLEQKRWFAKETYFRKNYNIKTIDDRAYESLKNAKRGDQVIFDAINYDILSNLRYADQFFYTQLDKRGDNE